MLTQQELHGNWNEIKGRLQEMWGNLTDDELTQSKGSIKTLVGTIQKKTGENKEKIERYLDEILDESAKTVSNAAETVREYAAQASECARDYTQQAGDVAREQYEAASQVVQEGCEQAAQMVKKRPVESIAVTFGVGLIVGAVVGLIARSR